MLCTAASLGAADRPISNERLRLAMLQTIFPGAAISLERGVRIDNVWPKNVKRGEISYPEAMAHENVYRIVGPPMNEVERHASEDVLTRRLSDTRQVRLMLFRWPDEIDSGMLAVVQYAFEGVVPAGCCWSVGRLIHLDKDTAYSKVRSEYLLQTWHHSSLQRIELMNLSGDGVHDLVVESDFGGAGTHATALQIFDLRHANFEQILNIDSRLEYMDQDGYTQTLDIPRTLRTHGQQFCVTKRTLFENGKYFFPPRISHPCYQRGEGVGLQ
jgi:hypothetical protein